MYRSGFQNWLSLTVQRWRWRMCWLFGHRWEIGEWEHQRCTVANWARGHICGRCGDTEREQVCSNTKPLDVA